jgi:pyoverdine/dityrosine biosynthesis protein Dit1
MLCVAQDGGEKAGRNFATLIVKAIQPKKNDKYGSLERCQEKEFERCWKGTQCPEKKAGRCKIPIKIDEWNNAVKKSFLLVCM